MPKDLDTATIACWAWGIHRAVDYLTTLKEEVDPKRIAAVGHSRLGKTALLAAAFDERIALAIPHQAGCGGTAPTARRAKVSKARPSSGSTPASRTGSTPRFKEFNDDPTRLPFDQHCLVALCAPRPVLFSNADEDLWANPDGQFEVLKAADPVYRFLDAGGLDAKADPAARQARGQHARLLHPRRQALDDAEDWKVFLDFADKHLGKP